MNVQNNSIQQHTIDKDYLNSIIGKKISDVLDKIEFSNNNVIFYDEPPSIGRGIIVTTNSDTKYYIYININDSIQRLDQKWTIDEFKNKIIEGVVYQSGEEIILAGKIPYIENMIQFSTTLRSEK